MKNLYKNTESLDSRLLSKFDLTQDLLQENAACELEKLIESKTHKNSFIIIVCGGGDNGADGYALARKLHKNYKVRILKAKEPTSKMCKIQANRASLVGIEFIKRLLHCDVIVDCLFGSGFKGELDDEFISLIESMNQFGRIKIACDIPSGIYENGLISNAVFKADFTLSMGALKTSLFSDFAKDFIGSISVANLGVSRDLFEIETNLYLLESNDLALPKRESNNVFKNSFGHVVVVSGQKCGASLLAAKASFKMGAGLVSLLDLNENLKGFNEPEIMLTKEIPQNASVIVVGMGLGELDSSLKQALVESKLPIVIDADMFYEPFIKELLDSNKNVVLTPHPKELYSLLNIVFDDELFKPSFEDVLENRLNLSLKFTQKYPNACLVAKGANTIIAHNEEAYINNLGDSRLAKGGSGDVIAGIISAYLAQGFSPLESSINASLAHALAAKKEKNKYSLTPLSLISYLGEL